MDNEVKQPKEDISYLRKLMSSISGLITGTDGSTRKEVEQQASSVGQLAVERVFNKVSTEGDFHELLTVIESKRSREDKQKRTQSKLTTSIAEASTKGRININDLVEGVNAASINDLFFSEFERIQRYASYDQIYEFIPQMATVANTYAENILSPESFNDCAINITYRDTQDKDFAELMNSVFEKLVEKYKLTDDMNEFVKNTIYLGDGFKAVLPYRLELQRVLSEDSLLHEMMSDSTVSEVSLSESQLTTLLEISHSNLEITEFLSLNESNLDIDSNDSDLAFELVCLAEGNEVLQTATFASLSKEEKSKAIQAKINGIEANRSKIKEDLTKLVSERFKINKDWRLLIKNASHQNTDDMESETLKKMFNNDSAKTIKVTKDGSDEYNVYGSIVLTLDPNRVVKLQSDEGHCYGYFYLEYTDSTTFGVTSSFASNASGTNYFHNMTNKRNTQIESRIRTIKNQLITDLFIKNASEKMNKKFIEDNPQFREAIFSMLSTKEKENKNISISFIPSRYVHHFGNLKRDGYGQSVYEPVFFTAKLYLASLISAIMQKLVLAPEKRIFYVETGLDEDMEGAINSFVASLKSKDFKISNFKDINTSMNTIGAFHDLYIPKTEGQRPVEVETMPSRDVSLDNDFLEYLKKTMISGSGVPSEYISNTEEVEFARTLSMRHGRFVRTIITSQKQFARNYKALIINLLKNEYNNRNLVDKDIQHNILEKFNAEYLEVSFPQPLTIFSNIINEQLRTAQDISEFIAKVFLGERTDDEELKAEFVKNVVQDFLPTLDWDQYSEMFENIKLQVKARKLGRTKEEDTGY